MPRPVPLLRNDRTGRERIPLKANQWETQANRSPARVGITQAPSGALEAQTWPPSYINMASSRGLPDHGGTRSAQVGSDRGSQ